MGDKAKNNIQTKENYAKTAEIELFKDNGLPDVNRGGLANITALTPLQQRFVHLYLSGQYTLTKIAEMIEVNPATVSNWLRQPKVKAVVDGMQMEQYEMVGLKMNALTVKAINTLSGLLDSKDDYVKLNATKDILDRGGFKPKQEIKIDQTITYEQKLSSLIKNTMGEVIDVDFNEGDGGF